MLVITPRHRPALLFSLEPSSHTTLFRPNSWQQSLLVGPLNLLYWARVPHGAARRWGLTQIGASSATLLLLTRGKRPTLLLARPPEAESRPAGAELGDRGGAEPGAAVSVPGLPAGPEPSGLTPI